MADPTVRRVGPVRLLLSGYALFVLAAGGRACVQLATHPARAPLAYGLSAAAAVIYATGFLLLAGVSRHPSRGRRAAGVCCAVELAGVLSVGLLGVLAPTAFPDASVWSGFGAGYGYVPLILPILAGVWLHHGFHTNARTAA
ncbi:MAG TPA: hypothetical protein VEO01_37260 [Pseudonocardiaceae bacterium]|nr:hypothetical protein [Pseudonocardiaceae bacterium]